jgi:ketosteroid isomerase-like protein
MRSSFLPSPANKSREDSMKRSARIFFVIVTLAGGLPAQSGPAVTPHATLLAADRALAARVAAEPFATAVADALSGSGVLVWPAAAVVSGPAVVRQLLATQPGLAGARISWQPLHVEVAADGSLGLIWGVIALARDTGTTRTTVPRLGRFLAAWRREGTTWKIEALAVNGIVPAAEANWVNGVLGPAELSLLRSTGPAGRFVASDSVFAARAGAKGAAVAFAEWAAPDAVTFAGSGELNAGPARIRAALTGDDSDWKWGAVAAGASGDGSLGWTVGQATITSKTASGAPDVYKGKYLTLWRRLSDGTIRFIADGGNVRP